MARQPKGLSPGAQDRLIQDLGYREPVLYRRVPGKGRKYYDPKRPERAPVTEHYYLRIYKPSAKRHFEEAQYEKINTSARSYAGIQTKMRSSLADTYAYKKWAMGGAPMSRRDALKDPEFKELYTRLRVTSYEARRAYKLDKEGAKQQFAPDSEYAGLLVALGRRTGKEDFPVGMSPTKNEGGGLYSMTVVKASLDEDRTARTNAMFARLAAKDKQ